MAREEVKIQFWGEFSSSTDESFWIKDAMTTAVGIFWYKNFRGGPMPENVGLFVDRRRGVVVIEGRLLSDENDYANGHTYDRT